jgi:cysteinyl-tRNA synthetase
MSLKLYNDLTRKKETFEPLNPGKVGFYSCGPTVYNYFHIGNSRPFIVFDVLRRYLEYSGYEVTFVQNFTDIDDKMINRANELGITVPELAEKTIADYFEDADALGIKRADHYPRATEHIDDIIKLIKKLLDNGHAYVLGQDVYFSVSSFSEYGKLSKQSLEELQSGARVDLNPDKEHPLDFALWKGKKPNEPYWESPWGEGRPGWHIECSAMSMKLLGETIDIHSGGTDLTFPHHENEIAQAEAATGVTFVKYWIHNGYLLIDKEKMSKSLGNFLTARAAREKYSPLALRMFMLGAHYRSPINFAPEGIDQAAAAVGRLQNCISDLDHAMKNREFKDQKDGTIHMEMENLEKKFKEEMDDDFNTAGATGVVFEYVRLVNTYMKGSATLDRSVLSRAHKFFEDFDSIFGVIGITSIQEEAEDEIEKMIQMREKARKSRDFSKADAIRDELLEKGIVIEDTPHGPKWKKKL